MTGEASDPTSGTGSKGTIFSKESTLRIQEGGETSQKNAKDSVHEAYGLRVCTYSEVFKFQVEYVISD